MISPMRAATLLAVVAGLLTRPSLSRAAVRSFHSPSRNIECQLDDHYAGHTLAYCETFVPERSARLRANGRTRFCHGERCLSNGPTNAFTLRYGHSVRVGPFRCSSSRRGMRCVVMRSGHGFFISRERLTRF